MKNWKENYDLVTTFALGEATPEQSAMLEEQMKNDPELRAEVEEIRRMGDFLTDALAHEPLPENVEFPQAAPITALGKAPKKSWAWLMRAAVCFCAVFLIASVYVFLDPSTHHYMGAYQSKGSGFTSNSEYCQEKIPSYDGFSGSAMQERPLLYEKEAMRSPRAFAKKQVEEAAEALEENEVTESAAAPDPRSGMLYLESNDAADKMDEVAAIVVDDEDVGDDDDDDDAMVDADEEVVMAEEMPALTPPTGVATGGKFKAVEASKELRRESIPFPVSSAPALNGAMPSLGSPNIGADRMAAPAPEGFIRPVPMPRPVPVPAPERFVAPPQDRNSFSMAEEQKFQKPEEEPFSTFGVDVDTASYTLMRQYLTDQGRVPPKESVRVEEYINYFKYDLKAPAEDSDCPFETTVEIQKHPWRDGLYMAMVALKGREIPEDKRPKLNLVFLLDVSGSMSDWNKLPLVKDGMMKLLDQLKPEDHVSIVTYANGTEIKLEPTPGTEKGKIEKAILELNAYGGTNGGEGIQRAYELARKNFDKEAVNRVVLCTDGDFNVGMTGISELETLIESEAKSGVFLTVLGFGMGNFQDDRMKALASHGNGVYGYVDSRAEAKKMLCDELSGSLITIAKDVKLQIDFNPAKVAAYRLIGYETRHLEAKDFHNDRKDSGDLGAGHSVVALYELVPVGAEIPQSEQVDESRYAPKTEEAAAEQKKEEAKPANDSPEWFFVKLRWKAPDANESTLKTFPVEFKEQPVSQNFQWASGTALFAMLLRESAYTGTANFDTVLEMIHPAVGESEQRKEFEELVKKAK
ncbi:MAG: von Willebrand factor type A domain-containing protein [Thermoguttaceae bacterium]|nr:von Willebrand factor type A domain-containing protein [Thermoguttaceae bacterium]